MSRTLVNAVAIAVILAVGGILWKLVVLAEVPVPPAPPRELGPVPVRTLPLVARDLPLELEVHGTLVARRTVPLSFEVGGRLDRVLDGWEAGREVERGTELAALDPARYELAVSSAEAVLEEARAGVELAEIELDRAREAVDRAHEALAIRTREAERLVELGGVASDSQRDRAEAARLAAAVDAEAAEAGERAACVQEAAATARASAAEAALAQARDDLARTHLRAPFAGRLVDAAPTVGALVTPGASLGTLPDPTSIVLSARVPSFELERLRVGMGAWIELPTGPETAPDPSERALVRAVGIRADAVTRRGEVELAFVEPSTRHVAGRYARARIELGTLTDALWVPRTALALVGDAPRAFVLEQTAEGGYLARERVVSFERSVGEGFVVADGLTAGEVLVVHPLDRLSDGVAVQPPRGEGAPER